MKRQARRLLRWVTLCLINMLVILVCVGYWHKAFGIEVVNTAECSSSVDAQGILVSRLKPEDERLHNSNKSRDPIGRRFIIALFCCICGFWLNVLGWDYFDKQQRFLGVACIFCGNFLAGSGLILFWLSGFVWTWGWLL